MQRVGHDTCIGFSLFGSNVSALGILSHVSKSLIADCVATVLAAVLTSVGLPIASFHFVCAFSREAAMANLLTDGCATVVIVDRRGNRASMRTSVEEPLREAFDTFVSQFPEPENKLSEWCFLLTGR